MFHAVRLGYDSRHSQVYNIERSQKIDIYLFTDTYYHGLTLAYTCLLQRFFRKFSQFESILYIVSYLSQLRFITVYDHYLCACLRKRLGKRRTESSQSYYSKPCFLRFRSSFFPRLHLIHHFYPPQDLL